MLPTIDNLRIVTDNRRNLVDHSLKLLTCDRPAFQQLGMLRPHNLSGVGHCGNHSPANRRSRRGLQVGQVAIDSRFGRTALRNAAFHWSILAGVRSRTP